METILLFAPLIGSLICGFGWRIIGEQAGMVTATALLFLSAFLSWIVFFTFDGHTEQIQIMRWIESGTLSTDWAIRMDRLTAIMLIVITTVSSLVHLYSFGYMAHDSHFRENESYRPRFFAYLSFFTFAMLMLVTADNLIQMFFGWEGVGVASYLLIGFYFRKESAGAASIKAFVVNRVGDFGFALGIFGLFFLVDSVNLDDIFAAAPQLAETNITFLWTDWNAANLIAFLLFIGAMGKSAQLLLHTWLPDAMEGPTPVSALIHAATMVTAGVFLVCRMSPLMEFAPEAKTFIVYIGATTAFFAATVGLVQNDIKRVIAYSTCSQLGYMFVAAGVGVYSAAMFHLFTHAFFKAMLFLGAGSVIHGMHHEQDMRNYGNLRKKLPYTFWAMMIGTLAITGVGIPLTHIGFAGFLSKDAVIESAWAGGSFASSYAFFMLVVAAAMTSFYSWRLMFLTFYGEARGDKHTHEHAHESPVVMLVPLGVLAFGAVLAGMIWFKPFFGPTNYVAEFFGIPHSGQTESHGDVDHADGSGISGALTAQIIKVSSGGNDEARNPLSSASGPAQFIQSTWLRLMQEHEPEIVAEQSREEVLALRNDPEMARKILAHSLEANEAYLTERGHVVTAGRLYLAHFLGSEGAHTALSAARELSVQEVLGEGVVKANPFLSDWDIARLLDWADRKTAGVSEQASLTKVAGEKADEHGDDHGGHHYAFTGQPGEGALFIGPENHVLDRAHEAPKWVKVSPFIAMLFGFLLAYQMYIRRPDLPAKLAENQWPLYQFLLNKWYFDELYNAIFVAPARWAGNFLWKKGDGNVIDGGINGLSMGVIPFFSRLAGRAQSGYLFHYVFAMILGIVLLVTWMTLSGGAG